MSQVDLQLVSSNSPGSAFSLGMSADGRFVLVEETSTGVSDIGRVAVYDAPTGASQTVFLKEDGRVEFVDSAALSADGRYVAFELRSGGDNKIYRWDRVTGTTELVSETVEQGESSASKHPSISGDGRFVVFDSLAADLVPGDTAGTHDVFVADMQLGGIRRVYRGGTAADMSANGQYAYVISDADGNGYRVNIQSGAVDLVGPVENSWIQASQNGDSVVFGTSRSLSPADADGVRDVYVKDFSTGITSLISTGTTNDAGGGASNGLGPQISADGKRVVFYSAENTTRELLASDVASGTLGRVSLLDFGGAPLVNGAPVTFGLSSDGLTVAFATAGSLVPSDSDNRQDVYLARYSRPTLSMTSVSEDDRVNAAEEGQFVTVRGRSDAEGLQVVVTSPSGATATATVVGGIWTATVASSGVADGTRAFTAVVTDDAGVTNTASRSVLFDSVAPTLTFSLNNDATSIGLAQGPVSILHGSSDAIGLTVTIQVDGVTVATPTVQPPGPLGGPGAFSSAWTTTGLSEGQHTLTFSVSDAAGNVTRNTLDFLYDATPPKVAILSVAGDNVVGMAEAGKPVPVVGTSDEPFGTVEILVGGTVVGSTTVGVDGTWRADASVGSAPPNAVVTAQVIDGAGNVGVDTETVLVNRDVVRVSVAADGSQAQDEYGGFYMASLSGDGHLAAFQISRYNELGFSDELGNNLLGSVVKNLDTGALTFVAAGYGAELSDDGGRIAYYDYTTAAYRVRDLVTGGITPVNVTASSQAANADVTGANLSISADGRYVTFTSAATNLVPGLPARDPRYFNDRVFVKDLQTGTVSLVSLAEQDPLGGSGLSTSHVGGGRYVPFDTYLAGPGRNVQGNLLDANGERDVYLRDIATGAVTLISATPDGMAGNDYSAFGEVSTDGRYVVFYSRATDLVPEVTEEGPHAYLRDLQTGITTLLSATQDGTPRLISFGTHMFTISADNRFVGMPIVEGDGVQYYVKDRQTGALTKISTGTGDIRDVTSGDMSADGRVIVFASGASDLVPADTNDQIDVFLRLLQPDTLVLDPVAGDDRITPAERSAAQAITGTASARGTVVVALDGTAVATATIAADGHWATTINTTALAAGRHNITATATAGQGLDTSDGAILEVEAIPQVIGLSLAHDTGALANDYTTSDPTVAVTTSLPGDTIFFSTDNTTFSTRQPTFATDGSHTVYVRTVNDVGTVTGSANITFTLDRAADVGAPLALTIDATADGLIDGPERARVSYEVSGLDADATAVATFTDGARSVTAAVQANGLFTVDLSALKGQVTSRLVTTDLAGNAASVTGNAVMAGDGPAASRGRVLDGYLFGATVFADANGNRMQDGGEASTTTDSLGNFAGLLGSGNLVARGGIDISTELPFRGVLLAPAGSTVVTPLTTLAALLGVAGFADPVGMVLAKLGLPAGYDLLHADPIAGSALGDTDGRAVLVAGAEVQGTVALITAALVGAGQDAGAAAFVAADAIMATLGSHAALDLTSVADIVAIALQAGLSNPAADAVAKVAAATNAGLEAALSSPMLIADVASVQRVIQGAAASMIEHAGSDPARLGAVLAIYGVGVEPGNASPAALNDTASTRAGTALSLAAGSLLANDTDPDGHTLSLIGVKDASHGTVLFDPATGNVLFTPEADFTGQGSFTYTVTDGRGGIVDAHVLVTVDPLPTGSGWGDVHYVTYDGLRYDLQTTGDYLLTKARSWPDFVIEGRAEGEGGVSFLTAVTLAADGHNISFDAASPDSITVDGTEVLVEVGAQLRIGSLTITEADAHTYRVGTAAADLVEVIMRGDYLDIGVTPGSGRAAGSFEGLLGNFDGYAWNDLALRDGDPIARHDSALIESVYADSWRVSGPDTFLAHLGDAGLAERAGWHAASGEALTATQDWLLA